ncbi:MAG: chromosomal replication initiator protein DnaA [Clostridia bacterium]|nr:chromosomal replication initiator protein DnaA [Clostridia bacterium]MBQ8637355.1 chromosomal replication initiator protein DnaA [Clostridia bacterium]
MEIKEIWESSLSFIRRSISSMVGFNTYINVAKPVSYNNSVFTISVPSVICKNMIELRYIDDIEAAVCRVVADTVKVEIIVGDRNDIKTNSTATGSTEPYIRANLNPRYTFDNYVVGTSNEYATAAALNVAREDRPQGNPLFLYGKSGIGKTHLMQAIGNKILEMYPDKKVVYVTSERFTIDMINAVRDKDMESFRQKYRAVDALLIDDIQFIENKQGIQEEFFHTFNELYQNEKKIVITSDRMPKELVSIEERLITRFEWGLPIDITAPNYETRVAILKKKAEAQHALIPDDVLTYIAERVDSNIRELEGALLKIISFAGISNKPIDMSLAEHAISSIIPEDGIIKITYQKIMDKVCDFYEVSIDDMKSQSRLRNITRPRQIAMYLCKKLTSMNYVEIAKVFGNRDRTTVMYGVDKVIEDLSHDNILKTEVDLIMKDLNNI